MIDIHSHILHGLDDGAQTLKEAVEMVKIAAEDGITKIVATPHLFRGNFFNNDIKMLEKKKLELLKALKKIGNKTELYIGAEVHISHNLIDEIKKNRERLVINRSQYLLVEFPTNHIYAEVKELFFEMMSEGIVPIIAHPERNRVFMENPSFLYELLRMGVLTQANSGSFLGFYGSKVEVAAYKFLEWNFIHFIGTDAHNTRSLSPRLSVALSRLNERIGEEGTRCLILDNPLAVLGGEDIVYLPEPSNPRKNRKSIKINLPLFKRNK
jgi:protein-tyrosine phosphatase